MNHCIDCNKKISPLSIRCRVCSNKGVNNPRYKNPEDRKKFFCIDCSTQISRQAKRCTLCSKIGSNNHFYGKKHSEATRSKMSNNHADVTGKNNPAYTQGLTLKDYYCKDCNKEISHQCGMYGSGRCESCTHKIENLSEAIRKKMRDNHANVSGENNGRFGLPVSKETRSRLSLGHGGTGIPFENTDYGTEFTKELKEQVRKRDNHKCQICGALQIDLGYKLSVHHIDYDKLNCILNNLVSLCKRCHMSTNTNREYWIQYFIDTQILMV